MNDWQLWIGLAIVVVAILGGVVVGFAAGYKAGDRRWR